MATSPNDRICLLLCALLGAKVVATVKGGLRYQGILSAATGQGEFSVALRQAQLVGDPQAPLKASLLILARDLQELQAFDISLEQRTSERDAFKTDTDITGVLGDKREKELQAWGGDGGIEDGIGGMSLDEDRSGANRSWDQFATNERLYGTKTDYHEEIYTTKLDRSGADYRAREQRAAQLEREILKGSGSASLVSNAHMAEERGVVDDSGLDEEDRYGAVIRGPSAYVPPGARKTTATRLPPSYTGSPAPSPPPPQAVSRAQEPVATPAQGASAEKPAVKVSYDAPKPGPSLDTSFRQFVSSEKERLTQKRQAAVKAAEKKEQDTRLASLLEFSHSFKLKAPMPADLAAILGRDPSKKLESVSSATTPVQSPVPPPRTLTPAATSKPAPRFSSAASSSSLIAEIPPFNPSKSKAAATPATTPALAPATLPKNGTEPTASTSKINANAPAFVFRPNPNASAFTPNFAPSSATRSPSRKPAELPINPFFGARQLKKGSSSMHVKEDFTPFKNGVVPEPSSIGPAWAFTGKPYRSMYPLIPTPASNEDDPNLSLPPHHVPAGYGVYQQYQPVFNRFQPSQQQQQQPPPPPPPMPHMPPPPQLNGNIQFQHYPPMGFPQQMFGASPNPQQMQQQQQQQFMRYPQFPPNGVPLGYGGDGGGRPGP